MATYVAVKVGDQYILQLKPWMAGRGLALLIGGSLAAVYGTIRGGWLGLGCFGMGLTAVGGSLLGIGPLRYAVPRQPRPTRPGGTPSFQHDSNRCGQQKPVDRVEEASMESFPASDSPTFTATTFP